MAPMAGGLSRALQKQSDLQLVQEGTPAFLLLLDGLVESNPDNDQILLAAAHAQTAYAMAFVDKEEADRARKMYAKAMDYGFRVLSKNRAFRAAKDAPIEPFERAVETFKKRDVPALYITGAAWAQWIIGNSHSIEAVSQFPRPMAMMKRVLELDPSYQRGGADIFFGIYYAVQPLGAGRDLEKSKAHFELAMELGGPDCLLPHVTFAEFYARYAQDRDLFEKTLNEVLAADPANPDLALMNEVAKKRARALLGMVDDFF